MEPAQSWRLALPFAVNAMLQLRAALSSDSCMGRRARPTCDPPSIHWAGGWLHPHGQGPALRKLPLRGTLPRAQRVAGAEKWGEGSPVISSEGSVMPLAEAQRPEAGKGVACWCRGQRAEGRGQGEQA